MYWYLFMVPFFFLIDQRTKKKAVKLLSSGEERNLFGGRIVLTLHKNPGAMLGFLKQHPYLLLLLNVLTIVILSITFIQSLFQEGKAFWKWAFIFMIAGGLGNLWDRISRGHVIDFFRFSKRRIVYNIADFLIFFGVFLAFIGEIIVAMKKI